MDAAGWCPLCYSGVRGRGTYRGHYGYRAPVRKFWSWRDMAIQRRSVNGVSQCVMPMSSECAFGKAYPSLAEFISRETWEDGSSRTLGTILILCEDGRAKCWLNDKDANVSCWVSGDTVSAALKAAEKAVAGPGGDWRAWRGERGKRK